MVSGVNDDGEVLYVDVEREVGCVKKSNRSSMTDGVKEAVKALQYPLSTSSSCSDEIERFPLKLMLEKSSAELVLENAEWALSDEEVLGVPGELLAN